MSVHIVYNFRTQQHRTVLKIIISQMMSTGEEGTQHRFVVCGVTV